MQSYISKPQNFKHGVASWERLSLPLDDLSFMFISNALLG